MTKYNLPDEGSVAWFADPLNPAVFDLDKRVVRTERRGLLNEDAIAAASALAAAAQTAATSALTAAQAAQATADGAIRTYYLPDPPWANGSVQPVANLGDLWFDTDTSLAYRWDNTNWVLIRDPVITQALSAAQNAQTTADGKITAYYQTSQPWADADPLHDLDAGDLWYDTNDKNKPYYYDGTFWTAIRDLTIADAQTTANAALAAATTDGLAPTTSPACEMIGGVGAILFRWTPITNANAVTYKVYADTTTGFTPGPSNLIGTTAGSQLTMRNLNGGAALNYTSTYYGRVIATDADGAAPAGPEAFAQLVQINTPDIAVSYIYAGTIVVDQLIGGRLSADVVMGATLRTALSGQRVEIGPLGIITYDSSGVPQTILPSGTGESNIFKGILEAAGITATGAISMRSVDNEVTRGAAITLQSGVTASKSTPSVVVDWQTVNLDTVTALGVAQSVLGPQHAIAMCGIGARFLVLFKNGSNYGWATFNNDGTAYTLGPTFVGSSGLPHNQISCKSLTDPVIYQTGRILNRAAWTGSRSFFDDFSGTLSQWTSTTNTAIASGVARISTPGVGSGTMVGPVRSMREHNYTAKIVPRFSSPGVLASQSWTWRAQFDATNYIEIALNPTGVAAGTLRFRYCKAGVNTDATLTHDPVAHQYFRIEHTDTLIQFYTSPATISWTQRTGVTNGFSTAQLNGMHPEITATATAVALELDIDNVEVNWTERSESYSGDSEVPAVGTNGTTTWVAELNAATPPAFVINSIDDWTMKVVATESTAANSGFHGNLSGIVRVIDAAWGTDPRWVVATKESGAHYWPFITTTDAYEPLNAFGLPTGGSKGVAYDGTNFWTLNASGQLAKHTTNTWTSSADPENWWAAFAWYDGNATGGNHETPMSAQGNFSMHKRARYTITTPSIPVGLGGTDDVDSVKLFIGRGASAPARTAMWLQGTSPTGSNSMIFTSATFSGTNPQATNNFPVGASAGKIRNSDDTLVISGDASILAASMAIGSTPVLTLTQALQAACTSNVALTSTEVDITGATVTFSTVRPNAKYLVIGSFYFSNTAVSTNVASGKLSVDGSVQTAFANFTSDGTASAFDRTNGAQTWTGTLVAAGSHTLKLRGVAPAAGVTVNSTHTTITVMIFE